MHSLVRRYLKTGVVFLMVGLAIGVYMTVERELFERFPTRYEVSAHTHALLVGFVMMMILGVALWMFPRPPREDTRYAPRLAEAAYWLVTTGTALRIAGELARPLSSAVALRVTVLGAALLQVAGLVAFFYTIWTRIRPAGSQTRESKGERF